jgi:2-polyprenyl-3-methyl-5-hydroxy-6-metoxy-1,4-benzoquinol methylase
MIPQPDPPQGIPTSEMIDQAIDRIYLTGALRAAVELGLWQKIHSGEDTAEKIATQEGWDLLGTRVLLEAVCALELLTKEGDRYILVPESACYLIPGKPTYKGSLLMNEMNWEGNGRLAEAVRSGKRPIHYDATSSEVVNTWIADYSRSWVYPESYLETAEKLWQSLGVDAREGTKVLDVACGPAPYSLALTRKHKGVQLTWNDRAEILRTSWNAADSLGVTDQVSLLPGDMWTVDFGSRTYDIAYLGNVTHFFSAEQNTLLFRKVHAALAPGGMIVVNSMVRREKSNAAWADLWLYAATASGGAYDFTEYQAMLENAGFTKVEDINQGPIKAVKP